MPRCRISGIKSDNLRFMVKLPAGLSKPVFANGRSQPNASAPHPTRSLERKAKARKDYTNEKSI